MTDHERKIESASTVETERRRREIQLLLNVIEPDPEYQAFFVSDEASACDVSGAPPELVRARLEFYLRKPLPVPQSAPLWKLVDAIKALHPGWPEDGPPDLQ
jgi:glutathione S-transferase